VLGAFPDGKLLWLALIQNGWLTPVPGDPNWAKLQTKDKHKPLPKPWENPKVSDDIQRVLDVSLRVLGQAPEEARFGPTQEIREGWLQLRPR
jgi:hypothetical protein